MPIVEIRRYRHPQSGSRRFRALAADNWEIPIPQIVQDLDGWQHGISDIAIGVVENEDFQYSCTINVGVAEPFHLPDSNLTSMDEVDFIPLPIPVSVLISMIRPGNTGGRQWHETRRVTLRRFVRVDDHVDLPPTHPASGQTLFVTRHVRVDYWVIH